MGRVRYSLLSESGLLNQKVTNWSLKDVILYSAIAGRARYLPIYLAINLEFPTLDSALTKNPLTYFLYAIEILFF